MSAVPGSRNGLNPRVLAQRIFLFLTFHGYETFLQFGYDSVETITPRNSHRISFKELINTATRVASNTLLLFLRRMDLTLMVMLQSSHTVSVFHVHMTSLRMHQSVCRTSVQVTFNVFIIHSQCKLHREMIGTYNIGSSDKYLLPPCLFLSPCSNVNITSQFSNLMF